ncbi:hypothetical protein KFL_002190265 [Klebsormidium nitens]|uniref:Uncharacterized protein n=1 Tax=Klebsormidium nitens TaxID=105231 RepID=A0A1Y1I3K8_KLENI|nr:hypothetical protein KFL_002190265 [Klebsormidium nitens]|eukprot:GAQ85073.1 hypothetical protein KFL_002190265 [Klebsormidium nitens]
MRPANNRATAQRNEMGTRFSNEHTVGIPSSDQRVGPPARPRPSTPASPVRLASGGASKGSAPIPDARIIPRAMGTSVPALPATSKGSPFAASAVVALRAPLMSPV